MFPVLDIAAMCERGYSLGMKLIHSLYCPHELTTHLTTTVGTDKSAVPKGFSVSYSTLTARVWLRCTT